MAKKVSKKSKVKPAKKPSKKMAKKVVARASSKSAGKPASKSNASKAHRAASPRSQAKSKTSTKRAQTKISTIAESDGETSQSLSGVTLEHAKKIAPEKSEAFAIEIARMIRDDKCEDVVVLDVRGRSPVTDFLVIGSGTSDRQMRSVLQHVEDFGAKTGNDVVRRSVDERATWILADFVDVVVHLFEPNTRAHYDLEMLWGDSKRIAWERPDQVSRDYAGLNS